MLAQAKCRRSRKERAKARRGNISTNLAKATTVFASIFYLLLCVYNCSTIHRASYADESRSFKTWPIKGLANYGFVLYIAQVVLSY